jgi:Tol biopolymer transport system component
MQLTWLDRTGKELGKVGPKADQQTVNLSPDGNAVTIARVQDGSQGLWMHDLTRDSASRLTPSGSAGGGSVMWFADSSRIWFGMSSSDGTGLYQKDLKDGQLQLISRLDGEAVFQAQGNFSDLSRDGRFIIATVIDPKTRADLVYIPVESGVPNLKGMVKLLATDAVESQGQLSPDGKWLAYFSDESGTGQVYIRPFPTGAQVWKVSASGNAREPRWRGDGKELYFAPLATQTNIELMAVTVDSDGHGGLRIGSPQRLFEVRTRTIVAQGNVWSYSPAPDGKRFLVNVQADSEEPTLNVISNWHKAIGVKE